MPILVPRHARPRARRRRPAVAAVASVAAVAALAATAAGLAVSGAAAPRAGAPPRAWLPRPVAGAVPPRGPARAARALAGARTAGGARAAGRARLTGHGRAVAPGGAAAARAPRTSCRSVAHIGDSTSVDLISPSFLPDPAQRLPARYAAVGVRRLLIDASGGRSVVEALPGQVNGYGVARAWAAAGFRGCWVFALGTNDSADVAAGSRVGLAARIARMMSVARGQPVLWVNVRTQVTSGPWAEANERAWNRALVQALARYPNMKIFNWAAVARPAWFLPDGIHYDSAGCAARALAIADALARAFPGNGRSRARVVR